MRPSAAPTKINTSTEIGPAQRDPADATRSASVGCIARAAHEAKAPFRCRCGAWWARAVSQAAAGRAAFAGPPGCAHGTAVQRRKRRQRLPCRRCVSRGGRRSRVRWGGFASSRAAAHGKSTRLSLLGKCKGECVVNRPARAGVAHAAPATSAPGPGSPPPTSAPGLDVRSGRVEHDSCQPGAERDRREDRPRDDAVSAQHLAHSHFAHSHFAHSHFAPFPLSEDRSRDDAVTTQQKAWRGVQKGCEGRGQSRCRCGRGEPSPGADEGGTSPVPADEGGDEPSPGADVAAVISVPDAETSAGAVGRPTPAAVAGRCANGPDAMRWCSGSTAGEYGPSRR